MPSSYQILCQYVRESGKVISLARVIHEGKLPIGYRHAKRLVKFAVSRGELKVKRQADGQGRPLVLEICNGD